MEKPLYQREVWKVISLVKSNVTCRYFKGRKCRHESNADPRKICSFENCPICIEKLCKISKCLIREKFSGKEGRKDEFYKTEM